MLEGRLGSEFIFPSRIIAISQWVAVTPAQLQNPDLFGKTALWDYWGSLNCEGDEHTESKPETGLLRTKRRGRRQCCFFYLLPTSLFKLSSPDRTEGNGPSVHNSAHPGVQM